MKRTCPVHERGSVLGRSSVFEGRRKTYATARKSVSTGEVQRKTVIGINAFPKTLRRTRVNATFEQSGIGFFFLTTISYRGTRRVEYRDIFIGSKGARTQSRVHTPNARRSYNNRYIMVIDYRARETLRIRRGCLADPFEYNRNSSGNGRRIYFRRFTYIHSGPMSVDGRIVLRRLYL